MKRIFSKSSFAQFGVIRDICISKKGAISWTSWEFPFYRS